MHIWRHFKRPFTHIFLHQIIIYMRKEIFKKIANKIVVISPLSLQRSVLKIGYFRIRIVNLVVGEMALLNQRSHLATVRCLTPVVLIINFQALRTIFNQLEIFRRKQIP